MRELDRHAAEPATGPTAAPAPPGGPFAMREGAAELRVAVVGTGRAGTALAEALGGAGVQVLGPVGREPIPYAEDGHLDAVLLCVPDGEIAAAARAVSGAAPLVGHTSGATPLDAMAPAAAAGAELFGLHPLQTLAHGAGAAELAGASCAVAGSTPTAIAFARDLAERLGMAPFEIADADRAAYHAAASTASNFLVTLQAAAEAIAREAGMAPDCARRALAPLVRATVENWARLGPKEALTGPVARGDEATVAAQREAVERADPALLALFDALVERTRTLAGRSAGPGGGGPTAMRTVRTASALRAAVADRRRSGQAIRIGLVPTMGALHEGHLALIRRARTECDTVVMSLFVNPTQFRAGEDLDAYPRDEARDARLAEAEGVDILFAPAREEIYPEGFDSSVEVGGLTEVLCGDPARRGPEHFRGVTTVVAKLFNLVGPDVAYFGQKDAQQALVIRKLVRDLGFPVEIAVCPTVRDTDGLALSSRNAYLDPAERARATALHRALAAAQKVVEAGERDAEPVLRAARGELDAAGIEPEYLELRSAEDLSPARRVNGSTLLAVAARIGGARLIDNTILGDR